MTEEKIVSEFIKVLKKHGFKFLFNMHDAKCYGIGKEAGNERYAEIYKRKFDSECWVVGRDVICNKSISYPGGRSYFDGKKLDEYLATLPKISKNKNI